MSTQKKVYLGGLEVEKYTDGLVTYVGGKTEKISKDLFESIKTDTPISDFDFLNKKINTIKGEGFKVLSNIDTNDENHKNKAVIEFMKLFLSKNLNIGESKSLLSMLALEMQGIMQSVVNNLEEVLAHALLKDYNYFTFDELKIEEVDEALKKIKKNK